MEPINTTPNNIFGLTLVALAAVIAAMLAVTTPDLVQVAIPNPRCPSCAVTA